MNSQGIALPWERLFIDAEGRRLRRLDNRGKASLRFFRPPRLALSSGSAKDANGA